jgi:hypothetical protein
MHAGLRCQIQLPLDELNPFISGQVDDCHWPPNDRRIAGELRVDRESTERERHHTYKK